KTNRPLIMLVEFAVALLAIEGHPKLSYAAVMKRSSECIDAQQLPFDLATFAAPKFAPHVKHNGVSARLHCALRASQAISTKAIYSASLRIPRTGSRFQIPIHHTLWI